MIHTAEQIAAFAAATEAEQLIIKNAVDKLIFGAGSFEATVAKIEATISPIFTDADRAELATQTFAEHVAAELDTTAEDAQIEVCGYTGPMLRLRERLTEGVYKKAANGQPCCGDRVATLLGTLAPAQVIRACIVAMALPANPYTHLNVGQQSMNLRNKLRGCFKREEFGFGVLVEAVEQVKEEVTTAE